MNRQDYLLSKILETEGEVYQMNRDMDLRWKLIEPYVPEGMILEIGSAQGWFTNKMSSMPNRAVASFEFKEWSVEFQKEGFKDRSNVIVCKHLLSLNDLQNWNRVVEGFDLIFAMAVLHHYENPVPVLKEWSQLSPKLIIEMPAEDEVMAYNRSGVMTFYEQNLLEQYYEKVVLLGHTISHLGGKRPIWYCYNSMIERKNLDPYLYYRQEVKKNHHNIWFKDGKWFKAGKEILSGVNAWNITQYNAVYPEPDWWATGATTAYLEITSPTDIRPWNVLYTPQGLIAIDYEDQFEELKPTDDDWIKLDDYFRNRRWKL